MNKKQWQRAYEPIPEALSARVSSTLDHLEEQKVKKTGIRFILITALVLLALIGTAIALTRFGTLDFLQANYDETMNPQAADLVQTTLTDQPTVQLGDVTATLREAVTDGMVGYLVVEMQSPEGTLMTLADGGLNEPGDDAYAVRYTPGDGSVTTGGIGDIVEHGIDYRREAPNRLAILYMFAAGGIDPQALNVELGAAQIPPEGEDFNFVRETVPFTMDTNVAHSESFTLDFPGTLGAYDISQVRLIFTPMTTAVAVDAPGDASPQNPFILLDADGNPLEHASHGWMVYATLAEASNTCIWAEGYMPMEVIPDVLYLGLLDTSDPKAHGARELDPNVEPIKLELK